MQLLAIIKMKKLLLVTLMSATFANTAFAYQEKDNTCVRINDGEVFDVTELSNVCFTTERLSINIINSEKNTDVYVSDNLDMVALEGGKYTRVGHAFYLSADAPYGIVRRGENIITFGQEDFTESLERATQAPPKLLSRTRRSARKGGKGGSNGGSNGSNGGGGSTGAIGAGIGTALTSTGTDREMTNSAIGSGVGVIAGAVASRFVGKNKAEAVAAATSSTVTNTLNNAEPGGADPMGSLAHKSMGGTQGCIGCH